MRKIFAIIFFLIAGHRALATEWFTYYIYVQTEYLQGPWIRANILDNSGAYLQPRQFEDLFSISGDGLDMANAILEHLKKETPERYKFDCTISISKDTIIIQTKDSITDFAAVKNELTASYVLNNFYSVKIIQPNKTAMFSLKDITVPYMDLVLPGQLSTQAQANPDPVDRQNDTPASNQEKTPAKGAHSKNGLFIWLMISLAINLLLGILLVRQKTNRR